MLHSAAHKGFEQVMRKAKDRIWLDMGSGTASSHRSWGREDSTSYITLIQQLRFRHATEFGGR